MEKSELKEQSVASIPVKEENTTVSEETAFPESVATVRKRPQARIMEFLQQDVVNQSGMLPEKVVLGCLKGISSMTGAMGDWPDIKEISLLAIRELNRAYEYIETFNIIQDVIVFYDNKVISIERSIPSRKRLAYFVAALLEAMMSRPEYMSVFLKEFDNSSDLKTPIIRGLLFKKIITPDAKAICGKYFQDEILCAELFEQNIAEKKRLKEMLDAEIEMAEKRYQESRNITRA